MLLSFCFQCFHPPHGAAAASLLAAVLRSRVIQANRIITILNDPERQATVYQAMAKTASRLNFLSPAC
jgi:hypothetical protein